MSGRFQLIFRNVFSILIQITQICQILFHQNLHRKIQRRINGLADAAAHHPITVITDPPVDDLLNFPISGKDFLFKTVVDFNEQFMKNRDIFQTVFKFINNDSSQLRIEKAQNTPMNLAQPFYRISRVCIAFLIILRENIRIELSV